MPSSPCYPPLPLSPRECSFCVSLCVRLVPFHFTYLVGLIQYQMKLKQSSLSSLPVIRVIVSCSRFTKSADSALSVACSESWQMSQHGQYQDPENEAGKLSPASINLINTSAFPAMALQNDIYAFVCLYALEKM